MLAYFQSNVVTERIITPQGNLTKTIITIPDCTGDQCDQGEPRCGSPVSHLLTPEPHLGSWNTVESDVNIHHVTVRVGPNLPDIGVILEEAGGVIHVEDVLPGGGAGLLPGHHLTRDQTPD